MRLFLLATFGALVACQTMKYGRVSDLNRLSLGMNRAQIVEVLGNPDLTEADGDRHEEYLYYKKMKHSSYSRPLTYVLTLREGKLLKWGEQTSD